MQANQKKSRIPLVFFSLSAIILACAILTYIIPSGQYERFKVKTGELEQTQILPDSYHQIPKHYSWKSLIWGEKAEGLASPASLKGILLAIPKGLWYQVPLILFILVIGGVFSLIDHSGTVKAIVHAMIQRFSNHPIVLLLLIYLLILFNATFTGGGIQFMPMIPVFMYISGKFGYDRIFGLSLYLFPYGLGWTAALTNPITLLPAQRIAEVPMASGIGMRLLLLVLIGGSGFIFLMHYGRKVKKNRTKLSIPFERSEWVGNISDQELKLESKHLWIAGTTLLILVANLITASLMGWFYGGMSIGFLLMGITTIFIGRMPGHEALQAFIKGIKIMIIPVLVIGFAMGIQVVIREGQILDTMLHAAGIALEGLPKMLAAEGMFVFQSILNFFIASPMQFMVSMPLMAPLSDLLDLSRQTAVLAFILGDGLSNLIIPTAGTLMAILNLAKVPYVKWARYYLPMFLITTCIGFLLMALAVLTGY
jgi:uncharacterized ion transporter superfamily protein YfcC